MSATTPNLILVVDDEDAPRSLIARFLGQNGYAVATAASGAAALEFVRTRGAELALVVLDMTMPGMDGAQTYAAVRDLQADLHVLIFSGGCEQATLQRLLATGGCSFLNKPCALAVLLAKVNALVARHPRRPPAA